MTDMTDNDINAALMKSLVWDRQAISVESTVLVATTRRGADESIREETSLAVDRTAESAGQMGLVEESSLQRRAFPEILSYQGFDMGVSSQQ